MTAPTDATTTERTAPPELVVARHVAAPAAAVWAAWTDPALFRRWWAPRSCGLTIATLAMDARSGGTYRLGMSHPSFAEPMVFYGRYLEATPPARLVWTNEEEGEGGAVTTVSFAEAGAGTVVTVHELYPTEAALDEAIASGSTGGWPEQFDQLATLLAAP